jgi:hypothetical protein
MFTHWACFNCRKSFAKDVSAEPRKCPECTNAMIDMGPFFEPPRKLNKKRWALMKLLADHGYRFNTRDRKLVIENRILQVKNPRFADVIERIEEETRKRLSE